MNFKEAQKKVVSKRVIGALIAVPAITSTAVSFLKMLYFRLDDGSQLGSAIARPFKQLVYLIYENTQFLGVFWKHSPTPDQINLSDSQNIYFLAIYILFFVGLAFIASGNKLSRRLYEINQKIEEQLIEESIKGSEGRSRMQIEDSTQAPTSTIFSQLHQLYIAPIVTAVVVAIIIEFGPIIIKVFGA